MMAFTFADEPAFVPHVAVSFDNVVPAFIDIARTGRRHDLHSVRRRCNADFKFDGLRVCRRSHAQHAKRYGQRDHDASYLHTVSLSSSASREGEHLPPRAYKERPDSVR